MIKKASLGFFLLYVPDIFAHIFTILKSSTGMYMKKTLLFAAVFMAVACVKESPTVPNIVLTVSDENGNDLNGRDFSVYVVAKKSSSAEALASPRLYDGLAAESGGGILQFSQQLTYDNGKPYCDFYVFSPYVENILPSGGSLANVQVEPDQSSGLEASDVMFGKTTNFIRKDNDPGVEMEHLFSRLDFVVETENPAGAFDEIILSDVVLGGTWDAEECVFTLSSDRGDVSSAGTFELSGDSLLKGVSAIIPPQVLAAGDFARIMIGGEEHSLHLDEDLALEAGQAAEISFSITAELNPQVRVDVSVKDWEGDSLDFSSGKLLPPGSTVTDIDGNEYPVVKIGTQYWMASNLRTTKLKDGSDIYKVESLNEWPVTDKPAYTVYECDFENNTERDGFLYNRMSVEYDKLCPEGWHVPTTTDWDMLAISQGGVPDDAQCFANVTEDLKSTDGWNGFPGTNATGFDGYPGGYLFSYISGMDGDTPVYYSGFAYVGDTAAWWSMSGFWVETLFYRAFVSYSHDMQRFSSGSVNAFPVRCVADYNE